MPLTHEDLIKDGSNIEGEDVLRMPYVSSVGMDAGPLRFALCNTRQNRCRMLIYTTGSSGSTSCQVCYENVDYDFKVSTTLETANFPSSPNVSDSTEIFVVENLCLPAVGLIGGRVQPPFDFFMSHLGGSITIENMVSEYCTRAQRASHRWFIPPLTLEGSTPAAPGHIIFDIAFPIHVDLFFIGAFKRDWPIEVRSWISEATNTHMRFQDPDIYISDSDASYSRRHPDDYDSSRRSYKMLNFQRISIYLSLSGPKKVIVLCPSSLPQFFKLKGPPLKWIESDPRHILMQSWFDKAQDSDHSNHDEQRLFSEIVVIVDKYWRTSIVQLETDAGSSKNHPLHIIKDLESSEIYSSILLKSIASVQENLEQLDSVFETIKAPISEHEISTLESFKALRARFERYHRKLQRIQDAISLRRSTILAEQQHDATQKQIEEAGKAIAQAESVRRLTILAFVFIPISTVGTLFGMNIRETQDSLPTWWIFGLTIALVLTMTTLFAAGRNIHHRLEALLNWSNERLSERKYSRQAPGRAIAWAVRICLFPFVFLSNLYRKSREFLSDMLKVKTRRYI